MATPVKHKFTPESLRALDKKKVETIRENAVRLRADDLIQMCDLDLAERKPAIGAARSSSTAKAPARSTARVAGTSSQSRANMVVSGYHFAGDKDFGVIDLGDGRFWTSAWVVADANVDQSLSAGAYLALHETKGQPSYRQGKIIGYRRASDNEDAIEFLVEAAPKSRAWVGAGSGDTGYKWAKMRDED